MFGKFGRDILVRGVASFAVALANGERCVSSVVVLLLARWGVGGGIRRIRTRAEFRREVI